MNADKPVETAPLIMRVSRRVAETWRPGAAWDLTPYLGWLQRQAARRGVTQALVVLTALRCHGCEQLKAQLAAAPEILSQTLVVLAEGGDLRGRCYFGVRLGEVEIHAPGVPTSFLLRLEHEGWRLAALGLGPFSAHSANKELTALLSGRAHICADARGATLRYIDLNGERLLNPDSLISVVIQSLES